MHNINLTFDSTLYIGIRKKVKRKIYAIYIFDIRDFFFFLSGKVALWLKRGTTLYVFLAEEIHEIYSGSIQVG